MGKFIKGCFTMVGGFFVLIIVLGVIAGLGRQSGQSGQTGGGQNQQAAKAPAAQAPPAAPLATVSASQILKAYENNKLKAEQTYAGKRIRVSGVVGSIGSDIMDQPYVTLGTGASFEVTQLQCMFSKEQAGQLANLDKGQSLTLEGTVDAYVMNVMVKDCRIGGK